MTKDNSVLRAYFAKLGLEPKVADIYTSLQVHGPQTISELARNSSIDRVQIYRLLDAIKSSALIEIETRYKRSILRAAPFSAIQVLLAKKEQELKDLQQDFPALAAQFSVQSLQSASTRVQFYEGLDGVKQMLWNETKGSGENLSILHDNMQSKTNLAFFERWTRACNQKGLHFRGVISDHFIRTQQDWYMQHSNEQLQHWQSRRISDDAFPIPYSLVVYDDVVLHYNWNNERIFGIEIHDPVIAQVQRQFFELLWRQAGTGIE